MKSEKRKKKYLWPGNYKFIYGNLWQYDKKTILFSALEVIMNTAAAFGAVVMPAMVVAMLERQLSIGGIFGRILLLFSGYGVICMGRVYLNERNDAQFIDFRVLYMMNKLLRKVIGIDYMQYEDQQNQRLLAKAQEAFASNYVGLEGILHYDVFICTNVAKLLLYAFLISGVNPWIVLMMLVISELQMVSFHFANRYELAHKDEKAELEITQNYLDQLAYEVATGKDVRLYQMQGWLNGLYKKVNEKYRGILRKEKSRYFASDLFGLFLQLLRDVVCYVYLIHMLRGGMAVSQFVLYIGVVSGFSAYFSELTSRITEMAQFQKEVGFLREFLDIEPAFCHGSGKKLDQASGSPLEIEFDHVTFSYPGSEGGRKILDDLSFRIEKGEKLALVGVNGAGKSTIVKLICGFYRPDAGHIYVNGIDIDELDLDDYYCQLAVVFQEAFAYSGSIAENVSCCVPEKFDRKRCVDALKKAGLWEKVSALPNRERTCLNKDMDENGILLSGGELQKLLLARALYKGSRLLLLDEPTAALDAISENEMYEKYRDFLEGKTALFISHRLASTRFCDRILFLENGRVKEMGSHEELLALGGLYARMFQVQSQYYKEGGKGCETEKYME